MDALSKALEAVAATPQVTRITPKTDPKVAAEVWIKAHNGVKGARRHAVKMYASLTDAGKVTLRAWYVAVLEAIEAADGAAE